MKYVYSIIFIVSFIFSFSQRENKKLFPVKYENVVYKIKIGTSVQNAFEVKGFSGLFTSLHGFVENNNFIDSLGFNSYKIDEILNSNSDRILKRIVKDGLYVTKIDPKSDLAFIQCDKFKLNDGFIMPINNIDSVIWFHKQDLTMYTYGKDIKIEFPDFNMTNLDPIYKSVVAIRNQKNQGYEYVTNCILCMDSIGIPNYNTKV